MFRRFWLSTPAELVTREDYLLLSFKDEKTTRQSSCTSPMA